MSDNIDKDQESRENEELGFGGLEGPGAEGVVLRNRLGRPIGSRVQVVVGHVDSAQQRYNQTQRMNADAKKMAKEMESQMVDDLQNLEAEQAAREKAEREEKVIQEARRLFELQEQGFATIHGARGVQIPENMVPALTEGFFEEVAEDFSQVEGVETPWGSIHDAILVAEIEDGKFGGPAMCALAKRLRVSMTDIAGIWNGTPEEEWTQKRIEKLLEVEELKQRGFNWDRLEQGVLGKLVQIVQTRTLSTAEYLAIGRVANTATRRGANGVIVEQKQIPGPQQGDMNVNVQINNQNPGGGLPGPGSIGTISLNLSGRTVQQLSKNRVIEGEGTRTIDSMEMLTSKDIKELNALTDSKDD